MDFLQSKEWREFQASFGRKTFFVGGEKMGASIIEHELPLVGKYFYVPRGIVASRESSVVSEIVELAKKEKAGWVRLDIDSSETLELLKNSTDLKIVKAPHDVQPKEIFVVDIEKSEEELLAEMKPKTRYNIKLSQKRGVSVKAISNFPAYRQAGNFLISKQAQSSKSKNLKYVEEFIRLTKTMAKRQGIVPHSEEYYKKMLGMIPEDMLRLYVAEYQGKIIAANVVIFYEDMAIYLHGSSDDNFRNVMAPHLLQWESIKEAKRRGCKKYDFGGVRTSPSPLQGEGARRADEVNKWAGITKFKLGFSAKTEPTRFLGSYDVVVNSRKYWLYRAMQKIKGLLIKA